MNFSRISTLLKKYLNSHHLSYIDHHSRSFQISKAKNMQLFLYTVFRLQDKILFCSSLVSRYSMVVEFLSVQLMKAEPKSQLRFQGNIWLLNLINSSKLQSLHLIQESVLQVTQWEESSFAALFHISKIYNPTSIVICLLAVLIQDICTSLPN